MAEELNTFYCRFDQCDYTNKRKELTAELLSMTKSTETLQLLPAEVENTLKRIKLSGHLLKARSSQLAGVLCSLFNRSLAEHSILPIWKSSITCP